MKWEFVRADTLRNVHGRLMERYGGLAGLRDAGALESAVARPANLLAYAGVDNPGALAAALPWAILRSHPFADGNKRAAMAALAIFVDRNGLVLRCGQVEETGMILRAASGEIGEDEWTEWVTRSVGPVEA